MRFWGSNVFLLMTSNDPSNDTSIPNLLTDLVSPWKKPRLMTSLSYEERLRTFSPSTYFAKPCQLSPIQCAALGWFNCGLDMLECSFCHAKLCIRVDSQLTIKSHEHVVRYWESMLRKGGHTKDDMCLFRKADNDDLDESEIPLYLAAVLDPSFVGLMEHPRPEQLLFERSVSLIPKLETISNFESLDLEDRDMVQDIASRINLPYDIIPFILGNWTWDESNDEFLCRVCHATFRGHVIKSHKYYCPVRCGYGNGGPSTWNILAKKVLKSNDSPLENKDGLEQLKAILTDK